ncbi:SAM-dependent methyltransferase [uncultured Bdellovibrio sp.]|uniref:SAM-dependent methyltransferase n=1 Tax=Bdellovibrio sp. HCB-162 TaxID=3394234 RepID=UPI0025E44EAF|nr:SAM-dependent methyltransferase [uncultured Bdellovibrio sp.]
MISFDANNPFPLLELDTYSYKEAQDHAVLVDEWLGFQIDSCEEKVRSRSKTQENVPQQNWEHLSVQAFQTPYMEIRNILDLLSLTPGKHIVDLGCAYGRMGFVLGAHHKDIRFSGYELEQERVLEAQRVLSRFSYPEINFYTADLSASEFVLPEADVYFIFDYGNESAVKKTLVDLQKIAQKRSIEVIARGRLSRFLVHKEHPWLSEVETPRHYPHFSIYRS